MSEPTLLVGRYEVGSELGRGGMGVVHRGRDRVLERDVAVKLLTSDEHADRFVAEAKRTAALSHAGIVAVFDAGRDEGRAFIVMELLVGRSLEEALRVDGPLPLAEVARIGAAVCDALEVAHAAGLVHRDVKPANLFLVTRPEGPPAVKLLDFGIAKLLDGGGVETDPGTMVGSYATMAPEQIRGEELDGRADLYALAVSLHRAATGRAPFAAPNAAGLILAHMSAPAPRLPPSEDPLRGRLDEVLQRMLAKDRTHRPESARAARDLLLGDSPASASTASALELPDLEIASGARVAADVARAVPIAPQVAIDPGPPRDDDDRGEVVGDPLEVDAPLPQWRAPSSLVGASHPPSPHHVLGASQRSPDAREVAPPSILASISPEISKRMAGYAGLLLFVLLLLFRVHWLVIAVLAAVTLFGVAAYVAATARKRF